MIHAAVAGGFGYLSYTSDTCGLVFTAGDPASPGYDSQDEELPAGSGLTVPMFTDALTEFLATGERPRTVRWDETTTSV